MAVRHPLLSLTRRQWTASLAALPLAAREADPQATSTTPPVAAPAAPVASTPPADRQQKALDNVREVSLRLSKVEVPMDVEPAFVFRP